jgi:hypothetical protein
MEPERCCGAAVLSECPCKAALREDDPITLNAREPHSSASITAAHLSGCSRIPCSNMHACTVTAHAQISPSLASMRQRTTIWRCVPFTSLDTALRHAFEKGAHDRGVAFVLKDQTNRVIPCAPNKILVSDIVALRPGSAYLPVGFRTKSRTTMVPIMQKLDRLIPVGKLEAGTISEITSDNAIEIIDLIERCFDFEPGYGFDWEACRAAIEYFSKIAPPPEERGECLIVGGTDTGESQCKRPP